ncbi:MAG: hypothetical protein ACRDJH_18710 [Thermomicrobiales bacterium]
MDRTWSRRPVGLSLDEWREEQAAGRDRTRGFNNGDRGYSGWTQRDDGTIVIVDYTRGKEPADTPFNRAYVAREDDLT